MAARRKQPAAAPASASASAPAAAAPAPVIGVVAGLLSEVRALHLMQGGPGLKVHVSAADPARAEKCAQDLLSRGAQGLISFGIAGGLAPGPRAGDLVLAHWIRDHENGGVHRCDAEWLHNIRAALARRGARFRLWEGGLMGAGAVTGAPAVKALLHNVSGALAADMESAAVARVCAGAGAPFAAVRAVSDARDRSLPPWLSACIDDAGRPAPKRVFELLRKNRRDFPDVLRAAADSRRAHGALREAARLMGPALLRR